MGAHDPVAAVNALGAVWSPDLDAYATGAIDAAAITCVLCGNAPCSCPPFGSPEYPALVDSLHHRRAAPIARCPACRGVLDGGPVAFRCPSCRRGVMAADIPTEHLGGPS